MKVRCSLRQSWSRERLSLDWEMVKRLLTAAYKEDLKLRPNQQDMFDGQLLEDSGLVVNQDIPGTPQGVCFTFTRGGRHCPYLVYTSFDPVVVLT